jgi:hypothetical protein
LKLQLLLRLQNFQVISPLMPPKIRTRSKEFAFEANVLLKRTGEVRNETS